MAESPPKRPRLVDVAKEAGVSVQAVSHVLSNRPDARIAAATRERIEKAAVAIGYVPNRMAQAMKSGRTNAVAVWLPIDRPTSTYFRMLSALYRRARADDIALMIVGVDSDLAYKGEGSLQAYWPVDGVIAVDSGKALRQYREDRRNDATPVCVLAYELYQNGDSVAWDVYGAAKDLVARFISSGRRNIVHITPQWVLDGYPREQRRRGYCDAMQEAGLEPILLGTPEESSDSAELTMASYIAENGCPEGVFGFLDNLAIGASRALLAAGHRIPEDCFVSGFSDSPEAADFRVPLSSVRIPVDTLIDQAWDWLSDRIRQSDQESRSVVFPMEFVERASTNLQ